MFPSSQKLILFPRFLKIFANVPLFLKTLGKASTWSSKIHTFQLASLSPDSIFSIIFSSFQKYIQSSTAYNDSISYVP